MMRNPFVSTPVINAIADSGGGKKLNKVLENTKKHNTVEKPVLVSMPMDCNFEGAPLPGFPHARGLKQTNVILSLSAEGMQPLYFQGESRTIEEAYEKYRELAFSNDYLKRIETHRRSPAAAMEDTRVIGKYIDFIKEIFAGLYKNAYKKVLSLNINLSIRKNTDVLLDNEELIVNDLLNEAAFSVVATLTEALEKISDDEMPSSIIISSHNFVHPINQLMSPATLALAFWQFNLLGLKKVGREESYFTKQSLPKVTYIDLTGFYSEINLEMANALSENIQTIMVYDETTGGPNILNKGCYDQGEDLRSNKRNFNEVTNNKGLLIPLKSSGISAQKSYTPNDMLGIFYEIIVRSVEKFKPYIIILNVSLIFDENSNLPFWLDEKVFGEILHVLSQLCDSKVIVYPFKLPNLRNNTADRDAFNKLKQIAEIQPKQRERLDRIFYKFGVSYDGLYVRNCLSSILEAIAGMSNSNQWEKSDIRKRFGTNPIKAETVHLIGRHYKTHPFYFFLYSKATATLARLNQENVAIQRQEKINRIPVFYNKAEDTTMLKLNYQNGSFKIELNKDSQYFIDYSTPEDPILYIFNGLLSQIDSNVVVSSSICNIRLPLELDDTTQPYVTIVDDIKKFSVDEKVNSVRDSSICQSGDYIFQIYGTQPNDIDSTTIFCYNFEDSKYFPIKVQGQHDIMPRHSVTSCAFQKDDYHHIYVFGGAAQPKTKYKDRIWGSLDIIDIVEVYKVKGPISDDSEWEYTCLEKQKLYKPANASFVPFIQSFAYYIQSANKILIMGGRMFKDSIHDWSFPIFEFDLGEHRFNSFQVILNYTRNSSLKKEVINHNSHRPVFPIAIANKNENFKFNESTGEFKFIIPAQDDEYIFTYSFDWKKKDCQYQQILHKEEKAEEKTPTLPSQSANVGKNVPLQTRVTGLLQYFPKVDSDFINILVQLIDWRHEETADEIKEDVIEKKMNDLETTKKESKALAKIRNLIKLPEFKDIFIKRDSRLQQLKFYALKGKLDDTAEVSSQTDKVEYAFLTKPGEEKFPGIPKQWFMNQDKKIIITKLIDWRAMDEHETVNEDMLISQIKKLYRSSVTMPEEFIKAIEEVCKNNVFQKMLLENSPKLKQLRKELAGQEEQSFLFDGQDIDLINFCRQATRSIRIQEDIPWKSLSLEYRNQVIEILNESLSLFSQLSSGKTFDSTKFDTLDKDIRALRNDIPGIGLDDTSFLSSALRDSCTTMYSDKLTRMESNSLDLNISANVSSHLLYTSSDSVQTRSTAPTSSQSLSNKSMSMRDLSVEFKISDPIIIENLAEMKNPSGNSFSVRQLLFTLLVMTKQLTSSSYVSKGLELNFNDESFKQRLVKPLEALREMVQGSDISTNDTTRIFSQDRGISDASGDKSRILSDLDKSVLKDSASAPAAELSKMSVQKRTIKTEQKETQTDEPALENKTVTEVEEEKIEDVKVFKEALSATNKFRAFFNNSRSEIIIQSQHEDGTTFHRRLRFKVLIKDEANKNYLYEDISFESSPSSVWIHQDCVVCYIDQTIKIRYQDVYNVLKNCVLYADLKAAPKQLADRGEVENLVFRKLFTITQDEQIINRSVIVNDKSLFLLAGKSYRFRKNNALTNNQVSVYKLGDFTQPGQSSSTFKDTEAEALENIKGESVSVSTSKFIFICPRLSPNKMEIYNLDGTVGDNVDLPSNFKNCTISMTYVLYKAKEMILFTQIRADKNREFMLFDIKSKEFEEDPVKLVPKETVDDDKKFQLLCSGFEEMEVNTGSKPIIEDITFYVFREDSPKFIQCQIQVGESS